MRVLPLLAALLFMMPAVAAEFGPEQNGYPVGEGGVVHDPAVAFDAEALAAVQGRAMADPALMAILGNEYPQLNRVGPATAYPYYPILVAEIERLALDHPDKLRIESGKSTAGLDIFYLEVADFANPDMMPLEEREVVMIDGGTHSNEYSGVYFVLALAQWLLDGSPEDEFAQWVLENRYTIITPLVNPDGSHAMGRLNVNAVNINRNFPVLWGGDGTDMLLNNPGPSAMSEIETQLVVDRVMHYQPDYHASIHCCGNLWLFPYGEDGYDPLDVDMMNHICDVAYPIEIRESCGPIWSTIYPASGSTVDTVYEYTGAVPFGFEMSGRSNLAGPWGEPVTFVEVQEQESESWGGVMHAFENVHLYGGYPEITALDVVDGVASITIHNAGYGPLNATVHLGGTDFTVENLTADATATLSAPVGTDIEDLSIDYQKRIMASPQGHVHAALELVDGAVILDGVSVGSTDGLLSVDDAEAPGLPLAFLMAALAAVFVGRRRSQP